MKRGLNSGDMQKNNRTTVFRILLERGSMSRTQLSAEVGLQKATITNIINGFISMGIVDVDGDSAAGRRGEKICLKLDRLYVMSMGITRKDFQIALYTIDGRQLELDHYEFRKGDILEDTVRRMAKKAASMLHKYGDKHVLGICVAVPGPYMRDKRNGKEVFDVTQFPMFNQLGLREILEDTLERPVTMFHDAKLSALAEYRNAPEAREDRDISLMVIRSKGYGIGVGMVINQKIVEGQLGIAGEVGYMGLNYNGEKEHSSFEACAGTDSVVRYIRERRYEFPDTILKEDSSYLDVIQAYKDGDPLASWAVSKMAWMLSYGIANLIYTINPDCIIIGPQYPDDEAFLGQVKGNLRTMIHPLLAERVHIRSSKLRYDSFLLGGYYYLIEELLKITDFFDTIREVMNVEENRRV